MISVLVFISVQQSVCVQSGQHVLLTWVTLDACCWVLRWLGDIRGEEAERGLCVRRRGSWSDRAFGSLTALSVESYPSDFLFVFLFVFSNILFLPYCYHVCCTICYVTMLASPYVDALFRQKHLRQTNWTIWSKLQEDALKHISGNGKQDRGNKISTSASKAQWKTWNVCLIHTKKLNQGGIQTGYKVCNELQICQRILLPWDTCRWAVSSCLQAWCWSTLVAIDIISICTH